MLTLRITALGVAYIAASVSAITGCMSQTPSAHGAPTISALQLHAHSTNYDGKWVRVEGMFGIGPELLVVYDSKVAFEDGDSRRCLSVALRPREKDKARDLNKTWVVLTGVYRKRICPDETVCLGLCSFDGIQAYTITRLERE